MEKKSLGKKNKCLIHPTYLIESMASHLWNILPKFIFQPTYSKLSKARLGMWLFPADIWLSAGCPLGWCCWKQKASWDLWSQGAMRALRLWQWRFCRRSWGERCSEWHHWKVVQLSGEGWPGTLYLGIWQTVAWPHSQNGYLWKGHLSYAEVVCLKNLTKAKRIQLNLKRSVFTVMILFVH